MEARGSARIIGVVVAVSIAAASLLAIVAGLIVSGRSTQPEASTPPGPRANPAEVYDPVRGGEEPPTGFRQLLVRDQIAPVYDPVYTHPASVDWPIDSLVLGVAGAETAKAYPITHLNQREMVIDSLEGIPILVTW